MGKLIGVEKRMGVSAWRRGEESGRVVPFKKTADDE
jgi:hypothetical protein